MFGASSLWMVSRRIRRTDGECERSWMRSRAEVSGVSRWKRQTLISDWYSFGTVFSVEKFWVIDLLMKELLLNRSQSHQRNGVKAGSVTFWRQNGKRILTFSGHFNRIFHDECPPPQQKEWNNGSFHGIISGIR